MKVAAIIPVAGSGKRFASTIPKQFLEMAGRPIIAVTLQKILATSQIDQVVLVCARTTRGQMEKLVTAIPGFAAKGTIVTGGDERQDSVYNGLKILPENTELVLVHDGVRPLISTKILANSIRVAQREGACVAAVPAKDTIKRVHDKLVVETLHRDELWLIQTPQTARYDWLMQAHQQARRHKFNGTDEASLLEWQGFPVKVIQGDYFNLKITTPEDLKIARLLFKEFLK
jgi:2-C-methyl-D-erythritol 4-phosphate cytidylyltransferase